MFTSQLKLNTSAVTSTQVWPVTRYESVYLVTCTLLHCICMHITCH